MAKRSEKGSKIVRQYKENVLDKIDTEDTYCAGCGHNKPLTNSHLCPRRGFQELIAVLNNVERACHDCHEMWEHPINRMKLNNYAELRQRVKDLSPDKYFKELLYNERKIGWMAR